MTHTLKGVLHLAFPRRQYSRDVLAAAFLVWAWAWSPSRGKVAAAERVRPVAMLPTRGWMHIMSAPKLHGTMDPNNRIWSREAEVALLGQVRQHRYL